MVKHCIAYGCSQRRKSKDQNVSFCSLPKNVEKRARWLAALKRLQEDGKEYNPANPANAHVCGMHFVTGKYNKYT